MEPIVMGDDAVLVVEEGDVSTCLNLISDYFLQDNPLSYTEKGYG